VSQPIVKPTFAALALVLAIASPAAAQDDNHGAVGLGLSVLTWSDYSTTGIGLGADLAHPLQPTGPLRWVADFGLWRDGDETDVTVLGGFRATFPVGTRVNIDVHALLGVAHWESFGQGATAFAGGPGAALRIWLTDRVGIKGQVDYVIPNWTYGKLYRTWVAFVFGLPAG
jgi:hypothetical protein